MLLKMLRNLFGYILVFLNWLSQPKPVKRSKEEQLRAQQGVAGLSLFQLYACPFCLKTRRALHRMNVKVDIQDIGRNKDLREVLENGGGRIKVPCLRIVESGNTRWMYESSDIIKFVEQRVSQS